MRIESAVTSVTWIPSEAVEGRPKLPFELGVAHYDEPPPDVLGDLDKLQAKDAFREANELRGWIEVQNGAVRRVRIMPGLTELTRTPLGPNSAAQLSVSRLRAALLAP